MELNDISQKEFERIEAYHNGKLLGDDLISFETKLNKDKDFRILVEDLRTVLFGIETQSLKEELDVFHKDITSIKTRVNDHSKVKTLNWKRLAVAAVLIIGLGSFWLLGENTNDRLYANYFTPDPGLPTTMSSNDQYEFYEAMVNYKQGKYKTAISKWETLHRVEQNNDTLNYFIGVAHLANKSEDLAIPYLKNAVVDKNFPFANDANFYLGLAYLKINDVDKAIQSFENSDRPEANTILNKLKK